MLNFAVVPLVGTWIEIFYNDIMEMKGCVVPLVGTWIEIFYHKLYLLFMHVVPLVGTWIEISKKPEAPQATFRRSPRGNVD